MTVPEARGSLDDGSRPCLYETIGRAIYGGSDSLRLGVEEDDGTDTAFLESLGVKIHLSMRQHDGASRQAGPTLGRTSKMAFWMPTAGRAPDG